MDPCNNTDTDTNNHIKNSDDEETNPAVMQDVIARTPAERERNDTKHDNDNNNHNKNCNKNHVPNSVPQATTNGTSRGPGPQPEILLSHYEAAMRGHAAAYASAAANAAWAAALVAHQRANEAAILADRLHHHGGSNAGGGAAGGPFFPQSWPGVESRNAAAAAGSYCYPNFSPYMHMNMQMNHPMVYQQPMQQQQDKSSSSACEEEGVAEAVSSSSVHHFGMSHPQIAEYHGSSNKRRCNNRKRHDAHFSSSNVDQIIPPPIPQRERRNMKMSNQQNVVHYSSKKKRSSGNSKQSSHCSSANGNRKYHSSSPTTVPSALHQALPTYSNSNQTQRHDPDHFKKKRNNVAGSSNSSFCSSNERKKKCHRNRSVSLSLNKSLAGKTGVCALYELCSKRRWSDPHFREIICKGGYSNNKDSHAASNNVSRVASSSTISDSSTISSASALQQFQEYIIEVEVCGRVFGRGRAGNKAASRQDAARQAIIALVPGVAFDVNGILVDMESFNETNEGGSRQSLKSFGSSVNSGRSGSNKKQPIHTFSGISSMSEDDDAYFASRGASACSALLHTMWQIDERITQPPSFTYDLCDPPPTDGGAQVPQHRPSFACTAKLVLISDELTEDIPEGKIDLNNNGDPIERKNPKILVAIGTSATKKESRHIAAAKLLSQLFPMAKSTIEAMASAEALKEQYALKRAIAKKSRKNVTLQKNRENLDKLKELGYCFINSSSDQSMPQFLKTYMIEAKDAQKSCTDNEDESSIHADNTIGVASLSLSEKECVTRKRGTEKSSSFKNVAQKLEVLEKIVEGALGMLELDEEGRASCQNSSLEDDIGRIILRRATYHDYSRIKCLLLGSDENVDLSDRHPVSLIHPDSDKRIFAREIWGNSVVVVLTRAIFNEDETPLGCAILTIGFSLSRGRVLNISKIYHAAHLPRERFVECLSRFSTIMDTLLIDSEENYRDQQRAVTLNYDELITVVEGSLVVTKDCSSPRKRVKGKSTGCMSSDVNNEPLQSVTEEDEELNQGITSEVPSRLSPGNQEEILKPRSNSQPSTKRSRVS